MPVDDKRNRKKKEQKFNNRKNVLDIEGNILNDSEGIDWLLKSTNNRIRNKIREFQRKGLI